MQKPDSAIMYLSNARTIEPKNRITIDALANAFFYSKNFDSAIYYWKYIVDNWDNNYEAMLNLVQIPISSGKYDEAEYYTDKLISYGEKKKELAEIYNIYGINIIKESESMAIKAWEKSIQIDSNFTKGFENLFRFYFDYKKDYSKARHYAIEMMKRRVSVPYNVRMELGLLTQDE